MATDERFDELISSWFEETAPAEIPARVLEETAQRTRTSRQQVRWRGLLRSLDVTRSILVLAGTAAIVVATVVALNPRMSQPNVGELPTTPDAWTRVSIDSRWQDAQVDVLVAGPRGLLAFLGELGSRDAQLSASTDGRTWTLVPNDQFPSPNVLSPEVNPVPAVVTTDEFLFVADGNDVWASDDGSTWQRRADRARDEDLRAGTILAVAAGGPGIVAVGSDNKAWYSEDGSDWTLAAVPTPPTEDIAAEGSTPTVDMQGVAVNGDAMVAWGHVTANNGEDRTILAPVVWTSGDGRSWARVPDVSGIARLERVAAGPDGFAAIGGTNATGSDGIWFSEDGRAWQPADGFQYDEEASEFPIKLSIAATSSGFVAAGTEGDCAVEPCPGAVAAIWTSPDGRSWSRLPDDDRFRLVDRQDTDSGALATSAVAWDSHFVVAGAYDASPVVWISGTRGGTETPVLPPTPSSDPQSAFVGVWISTSDGDGGTQRMTVEPSDAGSIEIVVTDTIATVCSGATSTMTGSGFIEGARLVIPAPDYRCDDGTEATTLDGPPLNEQLRNLTYTHDAVTDTLSVGIGDVWVREGSEAPPVPQPSEQVAPSSEPVAPTATAQPSAGPGSFEPIAGEISCGNHAGSWSYPATTAQLNSEVLGCSMDGSRFLIQKGNENLFILHADGSETQVTEQLSGFDQLAGSSRPTGATISPDGSRVVFAGLTEREVSCHRGALFAVDADGGQAELLWESQAADGGGIVRDPVFSPDGTQIAFADGYCDSNHSVWVMNADGSDAHQVVSSDIGPLGATHVHGLAWSAAGDEIALLVDDGAYTFATDGSGFGRGAVTEFCWPGEEC